VSVRPRGPIQGWRPSRTRQAGILADVVARYRQHAAEDTLPRGGRGIFYDLRPNGLGNGITYTKPDSQHPVKDFGPMEAHPDMVREVVLLARRALIIPESWVADQRAPAPHTWFYDESAEDEARSITLRITAAVESFNLNPQLYQPQYIEMWCEAADLTPRIARTTQPYGVFVYSGAGYNGLKGKRALARRASGRDVPTVILHIGDRDPHGEQILTSFAEDATAWAEDHYDCSPGWLSFRRIALTVEQATEHGLLDADGKAEADALPVPVMDSIITGALDELFDPAGRDRVETEQAEQRRLLPGAIRDALAALTEDDDQDGES